MKRCSGGVHGCCQCRVACVFQRLLEHLLHFQEGGGCSLYMHPDTRSVKCTFSGANPESDVVCVCGTCGSKRGVRQWVPLDREAICKLLKVGLKRRATFKSCAARRKALKDKGKGKGRVGPIPQSRFSTPWDSWYCDPFGG